MALKVAGTLQVRWQQWASLLQNYMGPLRLVLSPADMEAIFINLEVRVLVSWTVPRGPGDLRPCQPRGWSWQEGVL